MNDMKKLIFAFVVFFFAVSISAQDNLGSFLQYYRNKAFQEAYELLPSLVNQKYKDENIYVAFGDVYFEFEKYDSAKIMYEKAYDIRNDREEILVKLAKSYSYLNLVDKAIKLLKDYLKKNNDSWQASLELGYVYLRADSIRQAEYYISKARDLNKKSPEPLVALGDLYFAQKVYELARMNYEEALAINPDLTDARIKLATAYYWLANREADVNLSNELFTRSLKEWQIVSQKDPKNARAWYEQGKILFLARRFDDAARAFYQYVLLRPSGSLGRWYLAQSLVEIGKCDSAVQHLEIVAREIDSVRNKAELKLARCFYDNKEFAKSIEVYNKIKNEVKNLEHKDFERLASAYLNTGDTVSAMNVYEELLNKFPNNCLLSFQVGMLAYSAKKYDYSIKFYNLYLAKCNDENKKRVLYFLGITFLNNNQPDSAVETLTKAIQLDSTNPLSYIYRGDGYANLKKTDLAKADYQQSINLITASNNEADKKYLSFAFAKLCSLIFEQRDGKELQKVAKKWTDSEPNSENAWLYLAISYQLQKDVPNACKAWKKVLQINPKNKIANDYYNQLKCSQE
ncbi:tetratricopeptide repeat protein [Bacteroidetes/Chlorobi group bacterium Naka2016]|jgi:tetratricopeptide (TPR) repeat protein|nr:MAG: tetratricopeptide repeat protein [Bacteroidetes/Chlorobi group bacterium Naka2016]